MEHQAAMLDALIREIWGDDTASILDVSCGIGTQALGLAKLGYKVTASDLSREEVERAKVEAGRRELKLDISVADMRQAFNHHRREFDLVIPCDNSVPHLLTDEDILTLSSSSSGAPAQEADVSSRFEITKRKISRNGRSSRMAFATITGSAGCSSRSEIRMVPPTT